MFDVVKCNLTELTTKRCWFSRSSGSRMERLLSRQQSQVYLPRFTWVMQSPCSSYLEPRWEERSAAFVFL